jgi:hypothetical protein
MDDNLSLAPNKRRKIQGFRCAKQNREGNKVRPNFNNQTLFHFPFFFSDQNVKKSRSKNKSKDSTTRKHRQHQTPLQGIKNFASLLFFRVKF